MFWILLIGIVIVYCVLKGEDRSSSSSNKRSGTATAKNNTTKTLNVPYPYSAIKRMKVPVYIWETGINNKIPTNIVEKKITYVDGHHLLTLYSSFGFENSNKFEMYWKNAEFYDADGKKIDVQHKGFRGILPLYDEFGEHLGTEVRYVLD